MTKKTLAFALNVAILLATGTFFIWAATHPPQRSAGIIVDKSMEPAKTVLEASPISFNPEGFTVHPRTHAAKFYFTLRNRDQILVAPVSESVYNKFEKGEFYSDGR